MTEDTGTLAQTNGAAALHLDTLALAGDKTPGPGSTESPVQLEPTQSVPQGSVVPQGTVAPQSTLLPPLGPIFPTDSPNNFRAALFLVLSIVPLLAAILTVLFYLAAGPLAASGSFAVQLVAYNPLPSGLASAAVVALVIALLYYWFRGTAADHANARTYGELCQRLTGLNVRYRVACEEAPSGASQREACGETAAYVELIKREIAQPGLRWVLATGYINLWCAVHRGEEALIQVEPWNDALRGAQADLLRIKGSSIGGAEQGALLAQLQHAVDTVQTIYGEAEATSPPGPTPSPLRNPINDELAARATMREVRNTINSFRDDMWDALARSRNHLLSTLAVTGVVSYLVLAVAVIARATVPPPQRGDILNDPIAAAASFYLVGAIVGLFKRLADESTSASDVEDYGLSMARLLLTPVLSGLAAVGGAFIIAMVPATVNGDVLNPQTQSAVATAAAKALPALSSIFALGQNPFGLVIAAVFGLSPSLLISSIGKATERYKLEIRNSDASQAPAST